ncbi:MAG: restriction endonuclease subunit S [Mycobacterium sp.]|nr:MAG: restriction endonuclease subunit S [Mycobacterium sp.]
MKWPVRPLSEVAEVRLGRQRAPKHHHGDSMRPYLRAANVTWSGLSLNDVKSMNFTDEELATYRLEPGDIVLSEASGSPSEVGKPAIWSGEIADCAFQNTLIRVRPREHEPRFLLHYFRYQALVGRFVEHSRGVGIHHLGRARLAMWPTPVPTLDEQGRIVELLEDHLSRLDVAMKGLGTALTRSEALLTASLWRATHGLNGASTVQLQSVAEVRLGRQRSPKNHTGDRMRPYLRAANVDWNRLRLDDVKEMQFSSSEEGIYRLQAGDILLAEASGSAAEVGKSAVYRGEPPNVCFQNTLLRVRCREVDPDFVQIYLLAEARAGRFRPETRGVGINHLGRQRLATLPIQLPSPDVQRAAAAACRELMGQVERLRATVRRQIDASDALRRSLLGAAFSARLTAAKFDFSLADEKIDT